MLIIWGTYTRKKKLGLVAEYCSPCDDARAFLVVEHRSQAHIYYLPISRGKVQKRIGTCRVCSYNIGVHPNDYSAIVKGKHTIESLVDATNPNLPERMAERLEAKQNVIEGTATPEQRWTLLKDVFGPALDAVEKRSSAMHVDLWTGLSIALVILIPILTSILMSAAHLDDTTMFFGTLASIALPVAVTIYLLATDVRRFYRKRIEKPLARAIEPLFPEAEDLEQIKRRYARYKIGKRIDVDRLMALVHQCRAQAMDHPPG